MVVELYSTPADRCDRFLQSATEQAERELPTEALSQQPLAEWHSLMASYEKQLLGWYAYPGSLQFSAAGGSLSLA